MSNETLKIQNPDTGHVYIAHFTDTKIGLEDLDIDGSKPWHRNQPKLRWYKLDSKVLARIVKNYVEVA